MGREDSDGKGDQRGAHVGRWAAGVLPVATGLRLGLGAGAATETGWAEGIQKAATWFVSPRLLLTLMKAVLRETGLFIKP